jgi:hypothetical protein
VGILVNAVPDATKEGFADDTSVERCNFQGYIGVQASVRAKNLSVSDSTFTTAGFSAGTTDGGVGLLWEDGPGLFVTRSKFGVAQGVSAIAGLFVRGAQTPSSNGDRARSLLITRNTVTGDFATAFDLADVKDAVLRQNHVKFPKSGVTLARGRVGIVVRRAGATQDTEGYDLSRNSVRRAHYGVWLVGVGTGKLTQNDLGGCGSTAVDGTGDGAFNDFGGAVRVNLLGGVCKTTFTSNDFTGLSSPTSSPAVMLVPFGDACSEADNPGNRVDRGRALFGGENP